MSEPRAPAALAATRRSGSLLDEIAAAVGLKAALILCAEKGGTRIYVPSRADEGHWLVALLGRDAADRLCQHFATAVGGMHVKVPNGPRGTLAEARATILKMIAENRTIREIARASGYTERSVERLKRRLRAEDADQGRLL
ncbi:MAG: helix-turn-helix domain-containing protein [Bauldia sp.]